MFVFLLALSVAAPPASLDPLVLLSAPLEEPVPALSADEFEAVADPLRDLALQMELLDPRETKYLLRRANDFISDLGILQRRYHDLKDAPPLSDALRFPPRLLCADLLDFNRACRANFAARAEIDTRRRYPLEEAVRECDRLYEVYDLVRDANCDYYYTVVRRHALKRLRDLIGRDAYDQGVLPPFVPTWRFASID